MHYAPAFSQLAGSARFPGVVAEGFQDSCVVVGDKRDAEIQSGRRFAAGKPLMCDQRDDYRSLRVGLFGLDNKLAYIDVAAERVAYALDKVI